ncbi:MAG: restriction endonuclease subunit S [Flavobacterium sp.]|jgi:type I restriction enzyme S subunit|uniref:restriction endonuclease subunit S n=1 Tax=Flavobacterium sp. TaxID=239 RepID=UPI0022C09A8E|nr:restriction endonuclease subunit S [Flavobacterium sp.]MCZ8332591.1 restriction endonuclease subunit S [Flavobacterium sp.]
MAKGNRTIDLYEDDLWKRVFFDSVGTYVNVINHELSNEYPLEPLSNYIKIGGGYAFKTSEYKKSGVPIIRISDFNNEQIDISNCVFYNEDKSLSKYELNENDIIICLTGGTIAKLGIVQSGLGKLYMNQRVGRFDILDNSKFEKEYVYWIARSVQSTIKNLAWGAAIPNVSPKQIEKLQFSFPPIDVQQQIIEFLNDLKNNTIQNKIYFNESIENHIIELQNNNVALKEVNSELTHQLVLIKQLRQAFLREAMQGKLCHAELVSASQETGHDLLTKIKAEKAQLIAEKKLKKEKELPPITDEEIPFEIPQHWAWCRLGEICNTITKGSSPNWQGVQYVDSPEKGILFITSKNVDSFKIDLTKATYVEEKFNEIEPRSILKKGDLLTNIVGASIGRTALYELDELANINQAVCILRIEHNLINKQFLLNLMNSNFVIELMFKMQFAPGRANLSMGNVANFTIPLPPLHEQEQIVAKLEEVMAFCDGLEQSIKESQGYNEQLLQQVLREALQPSEVA